MRKRNKFLSVILAVCSVFLLALGGCGIRSEADNEYNCQIQFYVNPENPTGNEQDQSHYGVYGGYGKHVMDNMVKLLEAESFTEKLLLNGETLPKLQYTAGETTPLGTIVEEGVSWTWIKPNTTEFQEFAVALDDARVLRGIANQYIEELNRVTLSKLQQTQYYMTHENYLENEWLSLYVQGVVINSSFNETEYEEILADDALVSSGIFDSLITWYNRKTTNYTLIEEAKNRIDELNEAYFNPADEAEKKALDLWRATDGYKAIFKMYYTSVKYSYDEVTVDIETESNLMRSFIFADIAVPHEYGLEFACEVRECIRNILPIIHRKSSPSW